VAVGGSVGRSRRKEGGSIPSSSTFFLSIDLSPRTASLHKAHDTTTVFGVTGRILDWGSSSSSSGSGSGSGADESDSG